MPLISIIVPVYNADKYLHRCVDSILSQTFSDFEILLINDGSIDGTRIICDEYALSDSRIRVFHKQNAGVSSARNLGLDQAQGEYVMFMDSDDYWYVNTALEHMAYTAQQFDLDIVRGEYKMVDQRGCELPEIPISKIKHSLSYKIINSSTFYTQVICRDNFIFLSLIRKRAIDTLRFNVERVFLEDMEFYVLLLLHPMKCMYVPIKFYAYRQLPTSASHTPKIRNLADSFSMCELFDRCSNKADDDVLRKAYRRNSVMMYFWTLETVASNPYYQSRSEISTALSLNERQQQVSRWAKSDEYRYPIIVHFPVMVGVCLFRYLNILKRVMALVKRLMKQFKIKVNNK